MFQLLLVIIAIVIVVMLIRSMRRPKEEEQGEQGSQEEPTATQDALNDLDAGGVISILGTDYVVDERNRYAAAGTEWYEAKLTGNDSQTWWLAWEDSDEVSLTAEVEFASLGVSPEDLEAMADQGTGEIEHQGERYVLAEASEALYYRGNDANGEQMYYWDFHDASDEKIVGVVLWTSRVYNAYVGTIFPRSQVTVLSTAEGDE